MYGWRGRIGLLVPSSNTTMESELQDMLPNGISLHTSRMMQVGETEEDLITMQKYAHRGAEELATADVDLIVYGCTSGSFLKGEEENRRMCEELTKVAGRFVITTATAVRQALEKLGITRLSMVTPYPKETNEKGERWLESQGFQVASVIELIKSTYSEPIDNLEIGEMPPEAVYRAIRKNLSLQDIEGLLISCTNLRTIEIIEILEADFGVSVVTSNQASLWAALRELGCQGSVDGFGKLFT